MSLAEVAFRSRQEASKLIDRVRPGQARTRTPDALFKHQAPQLADTAVAGDRFRLEASGRFFAGASEREVIATFEARLPEGRRDLAAAADRICRHRFDLLGYQELSFGEPVDWHFDPVANRHAPLVHWSQIDPLNTASVGDHKVIWELNRHQWLVTLAQAYRLVGQERYVKTAGELIDAWLGANPRGLGVNWASSLEVAYRLIAWCWTVVLLRDTRIFGGKRFAELVAGIWEHAAHIERYLSYYFSPNTHLTGEALGLFYAGVLFPEFRDAERWRALGRRILIEESARQILPDGVYVEQASAYHRYTIEIYLHFLILARRNGIEVPDEVDQRVSRMLDYLLAIARPDGSTPDIGDADGGAVLPFTRRRPDDCRGLFASAAVVFNRADLAWVAAGFAPEVWWLLGTDGIARFEAMAPAPPSPPASKLFPRGGYAVMRSGWDRDALHLIADVGPLGCQVSGSHGHADLLSIQCSAYGEEYLVDAGTYCYTAEPEWRNFFRSTHAHSAVVVDGQSQAEPAGPFSWHTRPSARLREWRSTEAFDLVDAEHEAYSRLADPVTHRRRILFVKPRYWIIVDDLIGQQEHDVELRFQFASRPVITGQGNWVWAPGRQSGLWLGAFASGPMACAIRQGEQNPIEGWRSTEYGRRRPAPVVIYSSRFRLPQRFVTILMPVTQVTAPSPEIVFLHGATDRLEGLVFAAKQETVRFDDETLTVETLSCAAS